MVLHWLIVIWGPVIGGVSIAFGCRELVATSNIESCACSSVLLGSVRCLCLFCIPVNLKWFHQALLSRSDVSVWHVTSAARRENYGSLLNTDGLVAASAHHSAAYTGSDCGQRGSCSVRLLSSPLVTGAARAVQLSSEHCWNAEDVSQQCTQQHGLQVISFLV